MTPATLRWNDYALSEQEQDVRDLFRTFFGRSSTSPVVRAAEPLGFDAALWAHVRGLGVPEMFLPEAAGGDDAGVVELVLAAEQVGLSLAPVPLVEHVVATRLLVAADVTPRDDVVSLVPAGGLAPSGAVAGAVLALRDGELVLLERDTPPVRATEVPGTPVALWSAADAEVSTTVLVKGAAAVQLWARALAEWRVGVAAALAGLTARAVEIALAYSKERVAFGSPIGAFQAVAHPLVDAHAAADAARNLARKAAWFLDHEPRARPELPAMAYAFAARTAVERTATAVHVHGGMGITLEADVSLYYQRAALWAVSGGSSRALQEELASALPWRAS